MNRFLLFVFSVLILSACGQESEDKAMQNKDLLSTELVNNPHSADGVDTAEMSSLATMVFTDTVHDFGMIYEGEKVTYEFEFKNTGNSPLLISNAMGSCGCTAPKYPREAVKPGESGVIEVVFDSGGKQGHQEKSVTITTNSQRGIHMLYIKADVKDRS
ncbi:MAG: DUF1573 domain-containing protein [Chitinophagales bacterium]|nr:DUF1573 domain-containing protein [Chitinophagaceae bacterium]MCB9064237.1 DUF1573 domain-containing protein [Chitinophagales bacterium]